jgi:hypothetical protein
MDCTFKKSSMRLLNALLCLLVLGLAGCPEEASDAQPGQFDRPDRGRVDAGPDQGDLDGGVECVYPTDCPTGDCVEGRCLDERPAQCAAAGSCDDGCGEGESCVNGTCRADCPADETCTRGWCLRPCEIDRSCPVRPRPCQSNRSCAGGQVCLADRCINACTHDGQCPADGYCLDGVCTPFPEGVLVGSAPAPLAPAGTVHAGVGVVPLSYPIGVSMAGYGGRLGAQTPYNDSLGGSDRVFERQDVRVVVLSTADDIAILLRLPLCWSTDYLMTRTAQKVEAVTGVNYAPKLITFGTHSHSHPGRFWNLVPEAGLGAFGFGTFSMEISERYSDAFAAAILAALADLQPAKVGWHVNPAFDPERRIHSNRRGNGPDITDDRLMVMRIEDAEGRPMAGIVNLAIHGTHMNHPWVTGDVAGGIEVVGTDHLSAEAGRFAPVIFANGNAGNISPRGDDGTRVDWAKMQVVGHRVWPIFKAAWDAAEPNANPSLEVVQKRIPLNYELLGYDRSVPEYRDGGEVLEYGALQCVNRERRGDDPDHEDGALGCVLKVHAFRGAPIVQAHKSVLSALRLDDLVITTLPGEPTSQTGLELSRFIQEDAAAAGFEDVQVMQFGYANDHHLYLTLEEDWFRGGYEAGQSLWGWRLGRYFVENSRALAAQLFTPEREDNATPIKPTIWPDLTDDMVTPTAGDAPVVLAQPPEMTRRGQLIEMRWAGGHPGADLPVVTLERLVDSTFETAIRNAQPFDTRGFETLLIYTGDYATEHGWTVRWELPWDLPEGRYRMRVNGRHWDGEPTDYRLLSEPFLVQPATLVVHAQTLVDGRLAAKVNYPDGPSNDDGATPFEALEIQGHWSRLDPQKRWGDALKNWSFLLGPDVPAEGVTVTVDGEVVEALVAADTVDRGLVTARTGEGETVVELTGWESTRVEVDAAAGATVRVVDAFGNAVEWVVE